MTTKVKKPPQSQKPLLPASASSETKAKLKELAQIIPEEPLGSPIGTPEAPPATPTGAPEKIPVIPTGEATGLLAFLVTRLLDIILSRMNKSLLTAKEKALLEDPCNEIEVKYLSPIVRGYMEKTSPFAKLGFEIALIIQARSKESAIEPAPAADPAPAQ